MAFPKDMNLDIKELAEWISYDPFTGKLTWKRAMRGTFAGSDCGYRDKRGYINIRFGEYRLLGHRVGWALVNMKWPANQIDHKNRNPSDNRICNLREATDNQNKANTTVRKNKIYSSYKGVTWDKRRNKWCTSIYRKGRQKFLGYFEKEEDAYFAYCREAIRYDGEFVRI